MFLSIHAYVLIKTRREFIHLRRLFGDTRNQVVFEKMNSYFICLFLIYYLFLNLHILLLGQNNLS